MNGTNKVALRRDLLQRETLVGAMEGVMSIVQKSMEAKRELRNAEKRLRNFELVSAGLSASMAQLHSLGLEAARASVASAEKRVALQKERVKSRIMLLKARAT
jgi:hypothetical protein